MNDITIEVRGPAGRRRSNVVVRIGDRVIHADEVNLASDKDRARFLNGVMSALPEAPRTLLHERLLELATRGSAWPTVRQQPPERTAEGDAPSDEPSDGYDDNEVFGEFSDDGAARDVPDLPKFTVDVGDTHQIVDAIDELIAREEPPYFFQRGGLIVRIVSVAGDVDVGPDECERSNARCEVMLAEAVRDALNQRAVFERGAGGLSKRVDCPKVVADWLIVRDKRKIPVLKGIRRGPTILRNGRVLTKSGFDRESGLYCDFGPIELGPIPEKPTQEDARRAATMLGHLLREVPFVSDEDRSAAVAFLLSIITRRCFGPCPAFAATAPNASTGKGTLFQVLYYIATGQSPTATGFAAKEEEVEKRIASHLIDADDLHDLDNVERPVSSESLCRLITEPLFGGRLLGFSKAVRLSTRNTVVALTGNNLQLVGDMRTRAALIRLDARMERPSQRVFKGDAMREAIAHRAELLMAALTIVLAYRAAGSPAVPVVVSRFKEWSRWVQAPLVWAGCADPLATTSILEERDPATLTLRAIAGAWFEVFGSRPTTARDAIAAANRSNAMRHALDDAGLLVDSGRVLGNFLAGHEERIVDGRRFVRAGTRSHAVLWKLVEVPAGDGGTQSVWNDRVEDDAGSDVGRATEPTDALNSRPVRRIDTVLGGDNASLPDELPAPGEARCGRESAGQLVGELVGELNRESQSELTARESVDRAAETGDGVEAARDSAQEATVGESGEFGAQQLTPLTHGSREGENALADSAKAGATAPREFRESISGSCASQSEMTHGVSGNVCVRVCVEGGANDSPNSPPPSDRRRSIPQSSIGRDGRASGRVELGDWFESACLARSAEDGAKADCAGASQSASVAAPSEDRPAAPTARRGIWVDMTVGADATSPLEYEPDPADFPEPEPFEPEPFEPEEA